MFLARIFHLCIKTLRLVTNFDRCILDKYLIEIIRRHPVWLFNLIFVKF